MSIGGCPPRKRTAIGLAERPIASRGQLRPGKRAGWSGQAGPAALVVIASFRSRETMFNIESTAASRFGRGGLAVVDGRRLGRTGTPSRNGTRGGRSASSHSPQWRTASISSRGAVAPGHAADRNGAGEPGTWSLEAVEDRTTCMDPWMLAVGLYPVAAGTPKQAQLVKCQVPTGWTEVVALDGLSLLPNLLPQSEIDNLQRGNYLHTYLVASPGSLGRVSAPAVTLQGRPIPAAMHPCFLDPGNWTVSQSRELLLLASRVASLSRAWNSPRPRSWICRSTDTNPRNQVGCCPGQWGRRDGVPRLLYFFYQSRGPAAITNPFLHSFLPLFCLDASSTMSSAYQQLGNPDRHPQRRRLQELFFFFFFVSRNKAAIGQSVMLARNSSGPPCYNRRADGAFSSGGLQRWEMSSSARDGPFPLQSVNRSVPSRALQQKA